MFKELSDKEIAKLSPKGRLAYFEELKKYKEEQLQKELEATQKDLDEVKEEVQQEEQVELQHILEEEKVKQQHEQELGALESLAAQQTTPSSDQNQSDTGISYQANNAVNTEYTHPQQAAEQRAGNTQNPEELQSIQKPKDSYQESAADVLAKARGEGINEYVRNTPKRNYQ